MDEFVLSVFQSEVAWQARFVRLAAADLDLALKSADVERCWMALQSLLSAAANVSKLLWGLRGQDRKALRASLGVEDSSALLSRRLRNCFDHFDEHIDSWAESDTSHQYVDSEIGPMTEANERCLRHLDPVAGVVAFRGETYEIRPLVAAAKNVEAAARRALDKPFMGPFGH